MNRRTALRASGAVTALALAGCLADGGSPGSGDDGTESDGTEDDDPEDDGTKTDENAPYSIGLDATTTDGSAAINLSFDLVDDGITADSPAEIEIELTNATGSTIEISSGAPSPFGVIRLTRAEGDEADERDESITLWTDAYTESSHVGTDGKTVTEVQDIGLLEELEAGETIARTYELHAETPNLRTGTYEGTVRFGVESENESRGVSVDLAVRVEANPPNAEDDDSTEEAEYEVADAKPSLTDDAYQGIDRDERSAVLVLETETVARGALTLKDPEIEAFVDETEFSTAALVYVRTTAPQLCYRASVRSLRWSGDTLGGRVAVERTAPEDQPCGDAITHPAVLVRVRTDGRAIAGDDIEVVEA